LSGSILDAARCCSTATLGSCADHDTQSYADGCPHGDVAGCNPDGNANGVPMAMPTPMFILDFTT
jgi:hypothetical protein